MDEATDSKNGLSRILSRRRRHKKDRGSSSNSIVSTGTESDGHRGVREAIEGAIEKLKTTPTDEHADGKGLKKLMHKGMGSHRRRTKHEREEEERARIAAAARGRSIAERGTLENESSASVNESEGLAVNSRNWSGDGSSLLTYDSEPDSSLDTRPPLSTHASHLEFLTTSSPLLQSKKSPTESAPQAPSGGATPRSASASIRSDKLATSDPAPTVITKSLRAPTDGSQRRSPSPVGRLKGALRPNRKATSQQSSPERKAPEPGAPADPAPADKSKDTSDGPRGTAIAKPGSGTPNKGPSTSTPAISISGRPQTPHVQPIDTSELPQTPPRTDSAPVIVNTPPTPTDPTPFFPTASDRGTPGSVASNPNVITSPSGNMISHRRVRSTTTSLGPSKLSSSTSAPLTPTPENRPTPPNSNQTGFFNSVFSAAQNAANSLTTSIANTSLVPGGRHRSGTQEIKEVESPQVETLKETLGETSDSEDQTDEKEPAVKTLGMGDLSLSHLGITETSNGVDTPMATTHPDEPHGRSDTKDTDPSSNNNATAHSSTVIEAADLSIAQAEDTQTIVRPRSVHERSVAEAETPPNGSVFDGKTDIYRSGSIRSKRHRRTRGSSTTTGTAIGAAIAAATASVAHPAANGSTPKITGFAVASKKRNRDFHQLFRSVPDDDYLIEDYSCALQREILAHGRLYVSEGHLCFSSNIFGWVTTLVMSFDEIVSVEKRSTALVFKNGLVISTLHAKNIFASFTSRDSTYDLIVGIWKLGHPSLRSSLNGVRIDETGGGDKTEKVDGTGASITGSDSESDDDDGEEVYDEDEDEQDSMSVSHADGSVVGSEAGEKIVGRKPSNLAAPTNGTSSEKKDEGSAAAAGDFPGPATHAATDCTDVDSHYSKVIADEIIPAPLGKVYDLMFGPASSTWLKNWLIVDQKSQELTMDEKKFLSQDNKTRVYTYIKPLSGSSFAPKQTKCISTETLDSLDLEKAVSVTISTQTPDVPSGNVFSVKTKYCLTWADGNATRIQMNCAIEWTGKSWLKGPIEKGANEGQVTYANDIVAGLKAAVASRRSAGATAGKKGKKARKARGTKSVSQATAGALDIKTKSETWGVFEPARPIFGPIVGIVNSLATGNMMYGLFVGLLVASWFKFGTSGIGRGGDVGWVGNADRIAAYEEIWRREETELWEWLEHRAGMDTLRDAVRMQSEARAINDRLKDEKMQKREMDDAIRVTEEKLRLFKAVVEKDKAKKQVKGTQKEVKTEPRPEHASEQKE